MSPRRFLYITPFFPPMGRVGALRPLKFARHLPSFGWAPVALADLRKGDGVNPELLEELPDSTVVRWDYGRHAAANKRALDAGEFGRPKSASDRPPKPSLGKRIEAALPAALVPDPENIPLGKHLLDVPHALAASRALVREHGCEAIVVNADPYAALLVGERLSRETGLPLISDLRDPWALCSLRRPKRAPPQRAWVDRLERGVIEQSAAFILNTERSRQDYVEHYGRGRKPIPAERFHAIYNHGDAELVSRGEHPGFNRFTMLFLGNFRRFVEGDNLLEALAELRRRGLTGADIGLVVSGSCPPSALERARELGVEDMLAPHPFVPYLGIGPFMNAADLLISLSNDTEQRIPAKMFDYATSERPILAVGDTRELHELVGRLPGARSAPRTDIGAIADAMQAEYEAGRQRSYARGDTGLDSRSASRRLAAILDQVV